MLTSQILRRLVSLSFRLVFYFTERDYVGHMLILLLVQFFMFDEIKYEISRKQSAEMLGAFLSEEQALLHSESIAF